MPSDPRVIPDSSKGWSRLVNRPPGKLPSKIYHGDTETRRTARPFETQRNRVHGGKERGNKNGKKQNPNPEEKPEEAREKPLTTKGTLRLRSCRLGITKERQKQISRRKKVLSSCKLVSTLALEDFSGIFNQHDLQLLAGYALLLQRGNHVVVNMEVVPARQYRGQRPFRKPMVVAGGIMREDH